MIWAFGRLIFISFAVIICAILVVFGLRFSGQSQVFSPFHHPLLPFQPWLIARGGDTDAGPPQSQTALEAALKLTPQHVFLGLQLRKSIDGHWVAYSADTLEDLTDSSGPIQRLTLDEIKKLRYKAKPEDEILTADEIFARFPEARFFIDVLHPGIQDDDPLFALIQTYKLEERVILTSPFINSLAKIRAVSPKWLTGASTAELSKMTLMTSIFLEPIADLPGEVFPLTKSSPRLLAELLRRQKVTVLVTDDPRVLAELKKVAPNLGVLTTRPTLFADSTHE